MANGLKKPDQITGANGRGRRVDEWVYIDDVTNHQFPVNRHRDLVVGIIDGGQRSDRSGRDAETGHQSVGAGKGQAFHAEHAAQPFQVDGPVLVRRDQKHPAFLVFQEQVLGMGAGQAVAMLLGCLNGINRGVHDRPGLDPEVVEEFKQ